MEEGLGYILCLLLDYIIVYTGKGVVTVFSLGRWRGECIGQREERIYSPAGALSFVRDGRRVIAINGLLFSGIGFYVILGFIIFLI